MVSQDVQPWIYLNGYPGVGKLSIARQLAELIPGSKIVDNHLIIDLCRNVFEMASKDYEDLRRAIRKDLLTAISSTPAGRQTTYIFTGSHAKDSPVGPLIARDYENGAKAGGAPFVSIVLSCKEEEHLRRATNPSRFGGNGVAGKLTDVEVLKKIRTTDLFNFQSEHELDALDITELTALEAAIAVKQFVETTLSRTFHEQKSF